MTPRKENEASNAHKEELNEKDIPDSEGGSMYMREEEKKKQQTTSFQSCAIRQTAVKRGPAFSMTDLSQ